MRTFNRATQLTDDQIAQSETGPKFETVRPEQLFGPAADFALANRVSKLNLARYRELHREYLWQTGQEPRPVGFYD
jgi:hypothetical protein